jgi:type I restriction enzyme S subunit
VTLVVPVEEIFAERGDPVLVKHESWERVRLGSVAKILNGFAFKSSLFTKDDGFPLLRIRDVGKTVTDCNYQGTYEREYLVQPGDFVVGMDGDFKCAVWAGPVALLNQRVCKIMVTGNYYEPGFLRMVLPGYLDAIAENTSSQTVKHLSSRSLAELPLPLPPLVEQKRIVEKVEQLLTRVNAARMRLASIPAIVKRFRQSVLASACSGLITADWREEHTEQHADQPTELGNNRSPGISKDEILTEIPTTWQWCRLGSVAVFINGDRGKNYPNRDEYVPIGIPFINTGHIQPDGGLSSESMHYLTREKFDSLRSGKIKKGDLVYCLRGATLGKTALLDSYTEGAIASSLVIIRLNQTVNGKYAYYFLTSLYGKELVARFDNGSAQPNLSADSVKRYVFPLPPFSEQQEIVRRVEALLKLADAIEKRVSHATAQVEKLTQAVLAKAFRGELVPTEAELARREGRSYEPASVLLERIRAERK